MPSADSRCTVRMNRSTLSHDSVTCCGAPEVSSTAFRAQPPDLPPVQLVDMGFAVVCQLAPHRRPLHPVLVHRLARLIHASFRPRLATTPLRFSSLSPPPGWAGDFHPQAVEHVRHTNKKPSPSGLSASTTHVVLSRIRFQIRASSHGFQYGSPGRLLAIQLLPRSSQNLELIEICFPVMAPPTARYRTDISLLPSSRTHKRTGQHLQISVPIAMWTFLQCPTPPARSCSPHQT